MEGRVSILAVGRLTAVAVTDDVAKVAEELPWADLATVETHLSFIRAHGVLFRTLSRSYAEIGLSVPRANVLRLLHHAEGRQLSISDLGVRLGVSTANITRLVERLERDAWVERVSDPTDRRVTYAHLTEDGEIRFAKLLPQIVQVWQDAWSGLSREEKLHLGHLSAKLRMSLLARYTTEQDLDQLEY